MVWGSGIIAEQKSLARNIQASQLDIRAVRGPKTRELLLKLGKNCPEVYGDPAVLMPKIYYPKDVVQKYRVSLILHHEHGDWFDIPKDSNIHIINILTKDYESFITQVLESSLVISSSLHGIILAEAYGIPAVLLLRDYARRFKYEDWYYSTGRYDVVVAHSIEEALTICPMKTPDLTEMQDRLIASFPNDLWENESRLC